MISFSWQILVDDEQTFFAQSQIRAGAQEDVTLFPIKFFKIDPAFEN